MATTAAAKVTTGKGKSAAKVAVEEMLASMDDAGVVLASKRIWSTYNEYKAAFAELKDMRKIWRGRIGAAEAARDQALEEDDDGSPQRARAKLDSVTATHQDLQEAQAGRKAQVSVLIERVKELRAKFEKQIEGANQLDLFDN